MTSAGKMGYLFVVKAAVERKVILEPISLTPEGSLYHVILLLELRVSCVTMHITTWTSGPHGEEQTERNTAKNRRIKKDKTGRWRWFPNSTRGRSLL